MIWIPIIGLLLLGPSLFVGIIWLSRRMGRGWRRRLVVAISAGCLITPTVAPNGHGVVPIFAWLLLLGMWWGPPEAIQMAALAVVPMITVSVATWLGMLGLDHWIARRERTNGIRPSA